MLQDSDARTGGALHGDGRDTRCVPRTGLAPGTIVYTLDGALPVEVLTPGDRVITRTGARILREIVMLAGGSGFRLIFDTPEVIYADGEQLLAA